MYVCMCGRVYCVCTRRAWVHHNMPCPNEELNTVENRRLLTRTVEKFGHVTLPQFAPEAPARIQSQKYSEQAPEPPVEDPPDAPKTLQHQHCAS